MGGKREPKEQGELESDRLQNPSDPDAPHRLGETFLQHSPLADEIETLATDGAYHRLESHVLAESKHIEWNVSNIPGRPSTTLGVDQFVRVDDHVITACPEGHAPVKASYDA
ncbi:MAG: hypothetical protein J7639_20710 [Paenibacillaceae bacterium]|nr:hypothetical protein [Paenibacillaceae bacterium]